MGLAARQLGWGEQLYHAQPRRLTRVRDIAKVVAELQAGEYILQPWYRGRRVVWRPDLRQAYTATGKPIKSQLPISMGPTWAPLDLFVLRGSCYVLDVMLPKVFEDRILAYPRIRWDAVWSYQEVNEQLERQQSRPDAKSSFSGLVLKKTSVRYPWLPAGRQEIDGWWLVTRPL